MVLLSAPDEPEALAYLEQTMVLPSLENALEEMMQTWMSAADQGESTDAIGFLARWLMRNNPRHNPAALQKLEHQRAAAKHRAEREAARTADIERRARAAADWFEKHDMPKLELSHQFGAITLAVEPTTEI